MHEIDLTAEVVAPGDDGYDDAAAVFFATGTPALVVRPRDPDQVAEALAHAVRHDLAVSVRSGGHSTVGHGTNDGGIVIDLTHLAAVEVLDADRRIVRVGGGATWGKVAAALDAHGWGLTSGDTTSVGVGGLTLGGGIGWMVRRHGLAIDSLVGARVVTADGRLVTASEDDNPDLFWALRGGGGNFGVVVDFDFVAQEVGSVHYGTVMYRLDDAAGLIRGWRDVMRTAPDALSSSLVLAPRFGEAPPMAMLLLCYSADRGADVNAADAAIEPLLELGEVTSADITERRYAEVLEDPLRPPGIRVVSRNTLVRALDDDVIAAVAAAHVGGPPRALSLRSLGGAFARVPAEATAFAHRDAEAMIVCATFVPEATTAEQVEHTLTSWHAVAELGAGTYTNFQGSATAEDVAAAYPPATYARLAAVKRTYDPGNLFALNHNIAPETVGEAEGPAA